MKEPFVIPCALCRGTVTVCDDHREFECTKCLSAIIVGTDPYDKMSERRAKDRAQMLDIVERLCVHHGVPYSPISYPKSREVGFDINGETGLSVRVAFDGESWQPNVYVLSWHMRTSSKEIIRLDFPNRHEDVNPYHRRKATDVCCGFYDLIVTLSVRLKRIADGTATKIDTRPPRPQVEFQPLPQLTPNKPTMKDTIIHNPFHAAKKLVETRYAQIVGSGKLLLQVAADRENLWAKYLEGFQTEALRLEHNCSACRQFIKSVGALVTVDEADMEITTLWEFRGQSNFPKEYMHSFHNLDEYVRSLPIEGLFRHSERAAGADQTFDSVRSINWQHFRAVIPNAAFNPDKTNPIGRASAQLRDSKTALLRSLTDISLEAALTVQELIGQNSLLRGEEFKPTVDSLIKSINEYAEVRECDRDPWAWLKAHKLGPALSRVRSHAIGKLLTDLSEGTDLNVAIDSYGNMVDPLNYKRIKSVATPRMVEAAKKKLEELGLMTALSRRILDYRDLTAANALYLHRSQTSKSTGGADDAFAKLAGEVAVDMKSLEKVEEITIERFLKEVLPKAEDVQLLVERRHLNRFVTMTGATDPEANNLMSWDNSFSWSYTGGVADSIKARVEKAGGTVTGWMRCSLGWYNKDDLDLHFKAKALDIHVYYSDKVSSVACLDVDMNAPHSEHTREPVENIIMPRQLPAGAYSVAVHQYCRRETIDCGYTLEIEVNGDTHTFGSNKSPNTVDTINFSVLANGQVVFDATPLKMSTKSVTKWGVTTGKFTRVKAVTLSPNHWTKPAGNKHYMFMLEGAKADEVVVPFFNENLTPALRDERKTMEALAAVIETRPAEGPELSGVGFSSTQRDHVYIKVRSNFERILRVSF